MLANQHPRRSYCDRRPAAGRGSPGGTRDQTSAACARGSPRNWTELTDDDDHSTLDHHLAAVLAEALPVAVPIADLTADQARQNFVDAVAALNGADYVPEPVGRTEDLLVPGTRRRHPGPHLHGGRRRPHGGHRVLPRRRLHDRRHRHPRPDHPAHLRRDRRDGHLGALPALAGAPVPGRLRRLATTSPSGRPSATPTCRCWSPATAPVAACRRASP